MSDDEPRFAQQFFAGHRPWLLRVREHLGVRTDTAGAPPRLSNDRQRPAGSRAHARMDSLTSHAHATLPFRARICLDSRACALL